MKGLGGFQKKSRPFFTIIKCLKFKNGNFKTRDFSPLIERVLAGVLTELKEMDLDSSGLN